MASPHPLLLLGAGIILIGGVVVYVGTDIFKSPDAISPARVAAQPTQTSVSGSGNNASDDDDATPSLSPEQKQPAETAALTPTGSDQGESAQETPSQNKAEDIKPDGEMPTTEAASEAPKQPSFDIVRIEPAGDTTIAGRGEPNAEIKILSNGIEIANTKATSAGDWVIILDDPLPTGAHDLAAVSESGGKKSMSAQRIAVAINEDKTSQPLVAINEPGKPVRIVQKSDTGSTEIASLPDATASQSESTSANSEAKPDAETLAKTEAPSETASSSTSEAAAASDKPEQPTVETGTSETVATGSEETTTAKADETTTAPATNDAQVTDDAPATDDAQVTTVAEAASETEQTAAPASSTLANTAKPVTDAEPVDASQETASLTETDQIADPELSADAASESKTDETSIKTDEATEPSGEATETADQVEPAQSEPQQSEPVAPKIIIAAVKQVATKIIMSGEANPGAKMQASIAGKVADVVADETGKWNISVERPDKLGTHAVTVAHVDEAGNILLEKTQDFIRDPDPLLQLGALNLEGETVQLNGKTAPNSDIKISLGNKADKITADADGSWAYSRKKPEGIGDFPIKVEQLATDGRVIAESVKAYSKRHPPKIEVGNFQTTGTHITLSGVTTPKTDLRIRFNGTATDMSSGSDGKWRFSTPRPEKVGDYELTAEQRSFDGKVLASETINYVREPDPRMVLSTLETTDGRVKAAGETLPGAKVRVTFNEKIESVVADSDGLWAFTLPRPKTPGDYRIQIEQMSDKGAIVAADGGQYRRDPDPRVSIAAVRTEGDQVLISGTSLPGAEVTLDLNGNAIGRIASDDEGAWLLTMPRPQSAGDYVISAMQVDADGNTLAKDESGFVRKPDPVVTIASVQHRGANVFVSGTSNPGAKVKVSLKNAGEQIITAGDDGIWRMAVALPDEPGTYPVSVSRLDEAGAELASATSEFFHEVDPLVAIEAVELEKETIFIAGSSNPGSLVSLYLNGDFLQSVEAATNGRWVVKLQKKLEVGQHRFRADEVNKNGSVIARAEVPFVRAAEEPEIQAVATGQNNEAVEAVIIRGGDNLWNISRRLLGRGIRYTTIYQANKDQIRDPHLIFPGQVFILPKDEATALAEELAQDG